MYHEGLGKAHFWVLFVGFWLTYLPQYVLGLHGMPRRVAQYPSGLGWTTLNQISTVGAFLMGFSFVFMLINIWVSWRRAVPAGDNPWDAGSLEWFASSPPSHHNFTKLPPIRSERPTWDYNHPEHRTIPHGKHADEKVLVGVGASPDPAGSTPQAAINPSDDPAAG